MHWNRPGNFRKGIPDCYGSLRRPSDFDPHLDATIRVQVGRLRAKLVEYYSTVGAEDPIGVDLPKGTYALTFHLRVPQNPIRLRSEESVAAGQENRRQKKRFAVC